MTRRLVGVVAAVLTVLAISASPVDAKATGAERQPVVQEWDAAGEPLADGDTIGWTSLVRSPTGISGTTHVSGFIPDGVYTFWIVAIDPSFFPAESDLSLIHVNLGGSAVVGGNGRATVHWSADTGDSSIVTPGPFFGDLLDPEGRGVRIEIAYHGQVPEDGVVPESWTRNFWDGDPTVCPDPPFTPGNNTPPGTQGSLQPHCPVSFASTHHPS